MNEDPSRRRLGRGLAALIGEIDKPQVNEAPQSLSADGRVPIEFVTPNPRNPRRHFGPDFMISVPVVVAGSARSIQVPKDVKAYILPLRWHKLEAAMIASLR